MTSDERAAALESIRAAFIAGYDSYMAHAFPRGELQPLACSGGDFDQAKVPAVTLIDAMDTLVIMGNASEFRRAVRKVREAYRRQCFDLDVNVSVFEITIRVLGGLLSAHLFAVDPRLAVYDRVDMLPLGELPDSSCQAYFASAGAVARRRHRSLPCPAVLTALSPLLLAACCLVLRVLLPLQRRGRRRAPPSPHKRRPRTTASCWC